MSSDRRWILILGASSGFGEALARVFAREGYDVLGVHLDRRSTMAHVDALVADLRAMGRHVEFFNQNAADDDARAAVVQQIGEILAERGGRLGVFVHSLAFGTLKRLVADDGARSVTRKQIEMTQDVMAHSLLYWTQDLVSAGLFAENSRIFAMTSAGSHIAWPEYGPVSVAKAALEAYVRQLALELAPRRISVNAILAGVTDTPALAKIPGADALKASALKRNPNGRLTQPADVAEALLVLSLPGAYWINGNTLRVDGGEDVCG